MELTSLKNINQTIKETRILALIFSVILLIGFCVATFIYANKVDEAYTKTYIFDTKGNVYETTVIHTAEMRRYEYENHIKMFFSKWYAFDEYNYENNIQEGLELIGETGKELLNEYNDIGMLNTLIQKNIRYGINISDIKVDTNTIPVTGYIEGVQTGYRAKGSVARKIRADFSLYDVTRSSKNVHGCKINKWEVKYYNIEQ